MTPTLVYYISNDYIPIPNPSPDPEACGTVEHVRRESRRLEGTGRGNYGSRSQGALCEQVYVYNEPGGGATEKLRYLRYAPATQLCHGEAILLTCDLMLVGARGEPRESS